MSGHALTASFVKEKFGWLESDTSWWCGSARQSREHLFKECLAWKKEINELWKKVGEAPGVAGGREGMIAGVYRGEKGFLLGGNRTVTGPGNTSIRELFSD